MIKKHLVFIGSRKRLAKIHDFELPVGGIKVNLQRVPGALEKTLTAHCHSRGLL